MFYKEIFIYVSEIFKLYTIIISNCYWNELLQVEVIGGVEKYMAVCRECHKLKSPVKRSPFKQINGVEEKRVKDIGTSKRSLFGTCSMEIAP